MTCPRVRRAKAFLTLHRTHRDATPDGRSIAYSTNGNLWGPPIDGKPPFQITHLTDARPISTFAWSHDGKRLAIGRATVSNDIVLFKGLKRSS